MEQALANLSPSTIAALLVANLLAASKIAGPLKPLWPLLKQRWSVTIPALVAMLPVVADFFVDVQTWNDFLVAMANVVGLVLPGFLTPPAPPADSRPVAAKPHVFLQNEDGSPVEMRAWPVPALGVLAVLACLALPSLTACGASVWQAQRDASNVVASVANDTVEPALLAAYKATGLLVVRAQSTREDAQVALSLHQERWKPVWRAWAGFQAAHAAWQSQIDAKGDPLPAAKAARESFCELRELARKDWDVELPNFPGPLACTATVSP